MNNKLYPSSAFQEIFCEAQHCPGTHKLKIAQGLDTLKQSHLSSMTVAETSKTD